MRIIQADSLGAFYRHVNKCIKHWSVVLTLISSKGLVTTGESKAHALNEYFASVGIVDNGSTPTLMQCKPRHAGWAKKRGHRLMTIILSNVNRF